MNPFDLAGFAFLGFVALAFLAALAITALLRLAIARPARRGDATTIAKALRPPEIALLLGDPDRAIEAAIAGLHHRGRIKVRQGVLYAAGTPDVVLEPDGVYRGLVAAESLDLVEAYVMENLPATVFELCNGSEPTRLTEALTATLDDHHLLVHGGRGTRLFLLLPGLVWAVLALAKLGYGDVRDRPIALLCVAVALGLPVLFQLRRARRRTWLGDRVAKQLVKAHRGLEATARTTPWQLSGRELAIAYAVHGPLVAGMAVRSLMPSYHTRWRSPSRGRPIATGAARDAVAFRHRARPEDCVADR